MILIDLNQTEVTLQIFALNPDGSDKLDVSIASVRVYYLTGGTETPVLASTPLVQVGATNVWRYTWNPATLPVREYVAEYSLADSAGTAITIGEDIVVRDMAAQTTLSDVQSTLALVQADLEIVKQVETGRWKIIGNQMLFYDDTDSVILTFNLFDDGGLPSMTTVFERVPV